MGAAARSVESGSSSAETVIVYTDGACSGNPGPGGWGWITDDGRMSSGGEVQTTNQRMELHAVLDAINSLKGAVHVHSDSTYVVNCFKDKWYEGWKKRGWRNANKKPVANRDLWEPLIQAYLERSNEIDFSWVKGHSGDPMNEAADQLAVAASAAIKEQQASGSLDDSFDSIEAPWPVASTVWVVGSTVVGEDQSAEISQSLAALEPTAVVLSGLRRGAELYAAEAALRSELGLAVVLPFADPAANWPPADRQRFDAALSGADFVVTLPGDRLQPGAAVERRNRWASQSVVGALVIDDPSLAALLDEAGLTIINHG